MPAPKPAVNSERLSRVHEFLLNADRKVQINQNTSELEEKQLKLPTG